MLLGKGATYMVEINNFSTDIYFYFPQGYWLTFSSSLLYSEVAKRSLHFWIKFKS